MTLIEFSCAAVLGCWASVSGYSYIIIDIIFSLLLLHTVCIQSNYACKSPLLCKHHLGMFHIPITFNILWSGCNLHHGLALVLYLISTWHIDIQYSHVSTGVSKCVQKQCVHIQCSYLQSFLEILLSILTWSHYALCNYAKHAYM